MEGLAEYLSWSSTNPVNISSGGNRSTRRKPTTFDRALTNSSHMKKRVQTEIRTHDLRGKRRLPWRLRHQSPIKVATRSSFDQLSNHSCINCYITQSLQEIFPEASYYTANSNKTTNACPQSETKLSWKQWLRVWTARSLVTTHHFDKAREMPCAAQLTTERAKDSGIGSWKSPFRKVSGWNFVFLFD